MCIKRRKDVKKKNAFISSSKDKNKIKIIASENVLHLWRDYPMRTSRNHSNYADNSFIDLKLKYFVELNYDINKTLVVWGAGRRGKLVAKKLCAFKIDFVWVCNNSNKIDINSLSNPAKASPNPFNGMVTLDIRHIKSGKAKFILRDSKNRKLMSASWSHGKGKRKTLTMDKRLKPGIYTYKLKIGRTILVGKILKAKN